MTETVTVERDLPFPANRVWRALTSGALLAEWLMPNDFLPVPGHRFTFRAPPQPHWDGIVASEVLAIRPETLLSLRWDSGALQTTVTFTLTPTETGVRLRMEQAGFGPDQMQNRKGAEWGWPRNLDRLTDLLAREA